MCLESYWFTPCFWVSINSNYYLFLESFLSQLNLRKHMVVKFEREESAPADAVYLF